jgi:hypothetical protein
MKMKLFRISLLLFCIVLLSACIEERDRNCPTDRSVILEFAYNHNGSDILHRISSVDLFIYGNASGLLVHKETVTGAQKGADLSHLEPGEYRVVAWGNASARSAFGGINLGEAISNAYISLPGAPRSTTTFPGMGDDLYFASDLQRQSTLVIPATGDVSEVLPFSRAFIDIDVYVVGYEEVFGDPVAPFVEIGNANPGYDFYRKTFGSVTLREQGQYQDNLTERPALAHFRTKLFDINSNAMTQEVRILSSNNTIVHTIDNATLKSEIAAFMLREGITSLETGPDMLIPIIVSFLNKDISVIIKVPEFEQKPVDPII